MSVAMPQVPCQEEYVLEPTNSLHLSLERGHSSGIDSEANLNPGRWYGHGLGKHDREGVQPRPTGQLLLTRRIRQ